MRWLLVGAAVGAVAVYTLTEPMVRRVIADLKEIGNA